MFGPDLRSRYVRFSFALSLAMVSPLAFGCGADDPTTEGNKSGAGSADDDDDDGDDDDDDTAPAKDAGKDAGKKDAGAKPVADAGSKSGVKDAGATPPSSGSSSAWCKAFDILQTACGDCHGKETAAGAPMSLATYDDFMADAPVADGKVYEVVKTRMHATKGTMPPTGQLSADKLAVIDEWIDGGAEPGDDPTCGGGKGGSDDPPKSNVPWPPEGCEVYKLTAGNGSKVMVPAGQETHPKFTIAAPWGNKQVQALGFKPITDNSKVLHHWILYGGSTFLTGWAPGQDNAEKEPLPPDVGVFMPAGSMLLDMHYNNLAGKAAEPDQSGVEVCVTDKLRKFSSTTYMGFMQIPILPAGQESDMVGTCNVSVTQPVFLLSESPHAHKLATHMKFEIIRGGQRTVLRDEPFSFDAQVSRALPEPFELKNGDQVITTCRFNNDTPNLVTFGENTGNEMCFNFATYYPMGALSCGGGGGGGGGGGLGGLGGLLGL